MSSKKNRGTKPKPKSSGGGSMVGMRSGFKSAVGKGKASKKKKKKRSAKLNMVDVLTLGFGLALLLVIVWQFTR